MTTSSQLRELLKDLVREVLAEEKPVAEAALVTVAEYARLHAISTSTVRQAVAEDRLEVTRIGRAVRIAPDAKISKRAPKSANERLMLKAMR